MASHGSSIDLGADFDVVPTAPAMPFRWQTIRRFRLAVPICAVLFLISAAVAPPAEPLRLLARLPAGVDSGVMVGGPDIYVYGHGGIHAYRLADGKPRWSASTVEVATETTMTYLDGRVIVSMADTDGAGEHTVAFDGGSGRRLWTSDLGSAVPVVGGVLVESQPPPAGYNFPGTVPAGSFALLDAGTGHVRWHLGVPVNCLTSLAGGSVPSVLVELCANSSRLTTVDVTSGKVTAARDVDLGDPALNFLLPEADRMPVPRLVVAGATVLVAHAHAPSPTIDAYALTGLRPRWTGVPVTDGETIAPCRPALCVGGAAVDPSTGAPTTRPAAPPRSTGSLLLTPVGSTAAVDVAAVATGASVSLETPPPGRAAMTLSRWRAGAASTVEIIDGVAAHSCAQVGGVLACLSGPDRLSVWRLP